MSTLKKLFLVLALLTMAFSTTLSRAQEPTAEPDATEALEAWNTGEAESWTWDSCCAHLTDPVEAYEAALAAGETTAPTVEEWCLEQRAEMYVDHCHMARHGQRHMEPTVMSDGPGVGAVLLCQCVCTLSTAQDCGRCMEDPTLPEWLDIPGICHCIVQH